MKKVKPYFRSFVLDTIHLWKGEGVNRMRKAILLLSLSALFLGFLLIPFQLYMVATTTEDKPSVYVIPIEQTVERGLEKFLERALAEAEREQAPHYPRY